MKISKNNLSTFGYLVLEINNKLENTISDHLDYYKFDFNIFTDFRGFKRYIFANKIN